MRYMFLCPKCKAVYSNTQEEPDSCPDCSTPMKSLRCTKDRWSNMSNEQKAQAKETAIKTPCYCGAEFRFPCISGMPKYDEMSRMTGTPYKVHSILHLEDDGVIIEAVTYRNFSASAYDILTSYFIPKERLVAAELITTRNLEEKQKSVIGRGIAGAIVFGPIGAIIGGMSGIGTKTVTNVTAALCLAYESKGGGYENMAFDIEPSLINSTPIEFIDAFNAKYGRIPTEIDEEKDENGNVVL